MARANIRQQTNRRSRLQPLLQGLETRILLTGGRLDPAFGGGTGSYLGSANPGLSTGLTNLNLVQVESDNSVVAAGPVGQTGSQSIGLIHLNANGTLDSSFGKAGEADVAVPAGLTVTSAPTNLLVQPDGKIVVFGSASLDTELLNDVTLLIARFDANGQPDPTFGTNGVETFNPTAVGAFPGFTLKSVALQPNGQFVVVGTNPTTFAVSTNEITVTRLNANGSLDTAFGTVGGVTIPSVASMTAGINNASESAEGVVVLPTGQIVILASIEFGTTTEASLPELIQLNANGSKGTPISQAGLTASGITVPQALILQPDGQYLVLGETQVPGTGVDSNPPVLARINADGSLDTTATFPPPQTITISGVGPVSIASVSQIALQANGDVALTGGGFLPSTSSSTSLQAIRLTPKLTPDTTFGVDGVSSVTITPPGAASIIAGPLAVGSNNQIVVVGSNLEATSMPIVPATNVAVARLTATGSAIPGDYTGDGISDVAVYLSASGSFAIRPSSGGADEIIPFGVAGVGQTIPAPGDYTGSGVDEIAAYLPSYGVYAYRPANGGPDVSVAFGIPGAGQSIPAPGDYFGTGQTDIAVYLPSIASFGIRNPAGGPDSIINFGIAGAGQSIPAPGDYFGTGRTDIAVYLPSIGAFAIRNPAGGADEIIPFGLTGLGKSIPIPGDYDGSGKTELAVYLPSLGEFAYRPANGGPDVIVPFGAVNDGSLPAPGDYDGSGKTEIAIFDPNYASFAYRPAGGGPDVIFSFGTPGAGASIPTATPSGALREFNGVVSTKAVHAESVVSKGLPVPSGPSKRMALVGVKQSKPNPTAVLA